MPDFEHICRETAIIREENESPNDRNDRGIRKATEWYNLHIKLSRPIIRGKPKPKFPVVVLMTEDAANRKKAEDSGIPAASSQPKLRLFSCC